MALLNWRNTPSEKMQSSPSQRLLGRRAETLLPTKTSLLMPNFDHSNCKKRIIQNQEKQKSYYDKGTKELHDPKKGDKVKLQPTKIGAKEW